MYTARVQTVAPAQTVKAGKDKRDYSITRHVI